jgi:hypothetical protein
MILLQPWHLFFSETGLLRGWIIVNDTAAPPKRKITVWTVLIGIGLIAIAAMWIYAFLFADVKSTDIMPDKAWAARTEATCAAVKPQIASVPAANSFKNVNPRSEALRQRADVADQVTGFLRELVATLKADKPADAASQNLANLWLEEYEVYIRDRDAHVAKFRAGNDPPFSETPNEKGAPGPIRMDTFVRLNRMPSCQVPLDLG